MVILIFEDICEVILLSECDVIINNKCAHFVLDFGTLVLDQHVELLSCDVSVCGFCENGDIDISKCEGLEGESLFNRIIGDPGWVKGSSILESRSWIGQGCAIICDEEVSHIILSVCRKSSPLLLFSIFLHEGGSGGDSCVCDIEYDLEANIPFSWNFCDIGHGVEAVSEGFLRVKICILTGVESTHGILLIEISPEPAILPQSG